MRILKALVISAGIYMIYVAILPALFSFAPLYEMQIAFIAGIVVGIAIGK